jgi:hypothetical protein
MSPALYLNPRQSTDRAPTAWEDEFGDILEGAFASGVSDLPALVAAFNAARIRPREGGEWTIERFTQTLAELGA